MDYENNKKCKVVQTPSCIMNTYYYEDNNKPQVEIDEVNFTYSDPENDGVKFIDIVLTDNILEIVQSYDCNYQNGINNVLFENCFKLDISNNTINYQYIRKDNEGNITETCIYPLGDELEHYCYEEYCAKNIYGLLNAEPIKGRIGFIDSMIKQIQHDILSDELNVMVNGVLDSVNRLVNQDLNEFYGVKLLEYFKTKLDKLELKISEEKNKHVLC